MSRMVLMDYDKAFLDDPHAKVLPCNMALTQKKRVKEFMSEVFSTEEESVGIASCECGYLKGNFYEGTRCPQPHCRSIVKLPEISATNYNLWLEIPEFMPPVLHPRAHEIFTALFGKYRGTPIIDLILGGVEAEYPEDLIAKTGCGWENFHQNFDQIMHYMIYEYPPFQRHAKKERLEDLPKFLNMYRNIMFVRRLPILDATFHLMTKQGELTYLDNPSKFVIDLIVDLNVAAHQNDMGHKKLSPTFVDKKLYEIYKRYQEYIDSVLRIKVSSKRGFVRKNIMAFRSHFSCRAVIVPITESHIGDELHLPWSIGIECMKLEIINLLINRHGYSLPDAYQRIWMAEYQHDDLIAEILETLIKECPYKGLPILFNRNPSLRLGNIQLLFVTKFKKAGDYTIGFSPLVLKAPNADLTLGPYYSDVVMITSLIAGNPRSLQSYNVTGNGVRERLKICKYVAT